MRHCIPLPWRFLPLKSKVLCFVVKGNFKAEYMNKFWRRQMQIRRENMWISKVYNYYLNFLWLAPSDHTINMIIFLDGTIVILNSQAWAKGEFLKSSILSSIHRPIALNTQITQKGLNFHYGWMVEICNSQFPFKHSSVAVFKKRFFKECSMPLYCHV